MSAFASIFPSSSLLYSIPSVTPPTHLQVHMDGKPYKCNECESSFALLGEFRGHVVEVHADTKHLRCSECYRVSEHTSLVWSPL
jgi:hypothetical protein